MTASDPARRNSIRPRAGVNSLLETATVPHCFTVGKFSVGQSTCRPLGVTCFWKKEYSHLSHVDIRLAQNMPVESFRSRLQA
jgi:hypothetical protein